VETFQCTVAAVLLPSLSTFAVLAYSNIGISENYLTLYRQKNVSENKVEEFRRFGAGWFQKKKAEKK